MNTPDTDEFSGPMAPGAPATDAPLAEDGAWLLPLLGGDFTALSFGAEAPPDLSRVGPGAVAPRGVALPADGVAARRFDAWPGTVYLLRPDQHVCARWRGFDPARMTEALRRATAAA